MSNITPRMIRRPLAGSVVDRTVVPHPDEAAVVGPDEAVLLHEDVAATEIVGVLAAHPRPVVRVHVLLPDVVAVGPLRLADAEDAFDLGSHVDRRIAAHARLGHLVDVQHGGDVLDEQPELITFAERAQGGGCELAQRCRADRATFRRVQG